MMIKKGEMTIATIVAIALAVVVLIFLIYGFSTGWGNLWDRVTNIGGTSDNIDTLKIACESAVSTNSISAYCNQKRTLVENGQKTPDQTCKLLENKIGITQGLTCPQEKK